MRTTVDLSAADESTRNRAGDNMGIPASRRILIVSERFFPEEFQINELALRWAANGHVVSVLTQAPSYPSGVVYPGYRNRTYQREMWNGITVHRVRTVTGYRESLARKILNYLNFAMLGSLAAVFVAARSDAIFAFQTGPLTSTLPAVVARRIFRKRLAIWTLDLWPDTVYAYGFRRRSWLTFALDTFTRLVYQSCDLIAVSCGGFASKVRRFVAWEVPIVHVPNWPQSMEVTEPGLALSDEHLTHFTFAGNVGKVQNLERVLSGFMELGADDKKKLQLNIIGDGSNVECLKEIVRARGERRIRFWGRRTEREIPSYLAASDVLIISLEDESIFNLTVPRKFQTYLASGRPIFAVMNGEVREIVNEFGIGLVADPNSIEAISDGFRSFANMPPSKIVEFGEAASRLAESRFSREKIFQQLDQAVLGV